MKYLLLIIFFILYSFPLCSQVIYSTWIDKITNEYPIQLYLTAIGSGTTINEAEKNALSKLAQIFKTKIISNQLINKRTTEKFINGKSDLSTLSKSYESISLQSQQELINVKFVKPTSKRKGKIYILAYINRSETSQIYETKINDYNTRIRALLKENYNSNNKLEKYALLVKASKLADENSILIDQLNVIDPYFSGFTNFDTFNDSISSIKRNVANKIVLSFKNKVDEAIKVIVEKIIISKGFLIGKNGDFFINIKINYNKIDLARKEFFFIWLLSIRFESRNSIVFAYNDKGREGGITESIALSRAKIGLINSIREKLSYKIDNYFYSF